MQMGIKSFKHLALSLFLSLLGIIVIAPLSSSCNESRHEGAYLLFNDTILDLGSVSLNQVQRFSYVFTNAGSQALYLYNVDPDCNTCTQVTFPKDSILPNVQGTIDVAFLGKGHYFEGPHSFQIHDRSNAENRLVNLTFQTNFTK